MNFESGLGLTDFFTSVNCSNEFWASHFALHFFSWPPWLTLIFWLSEDWPTSDVTGSCRHFFPNLRPFSSDASSFVRTSRKSTRNPGWHQSVLLQVDHLSPRRFISKSGSIFRVHLDLCYDVTVHSEPRDVLCCSFNFESSIKSLNGQLPCSISLGC